VLNPAPARQLSQTLLQLCDIIVPNEHEVELLGGAARLLAMGPRAVVVTRGGEGADVHMAEGVAHVPPFPVTPLDTTAAGDSFCGALCARLAAGATLADALRFAAAAGALCTTRAGAVPSIPVLGEIERLLSEG
ncbi:MAG: PfkB family carbohydrate kinase, partial [Actinomycetota bacterium]